MRMLATSYALTSTTPLPFPEALERVRTELKAEGFGVLCEIDVQATMREKLGVAGEPYLILGACKPPLAHQASPRPRRNSLPVIASHLPRPPVHELRHRGCRRRRCLG